MIKIIVFTLKSHGPLAESHSDNAVIYNIWSLYSILLNKQVFLYAVNYTNIGRKTLAHRTKFF